MKSSIFRHAIRYLISVAAFVTATATQAASPSGPITIIVGFAPGGVTDVLARVIGEKLSKKTGQPVVVENRPGATSTIAAGAVARAKPDGSTLLFAGPAQVLTPSLYKLNHDPLKDFQPISMVASVPLVLAVHPSVPAKTVSEFIAYTRAHPKQLYFSSGGTSSLPRMAGELFKSKTKVDMTHVAYKGSGAALVDLLAGRVHLSFDQITTVLQPIQNGQLRALAVTTSARSPALPNVPTMAEAGINGYDVSSWNALLAPAGTPKEIVARLNSDLRSILAAPEMKTEFAKLGATPVTSSSEELAEFLARETRMWSDIVREAGITAE